MWHILAERFWTRSTGAVFKGVAHGRVVRIIVGLRVRALVGFRVRVRVRVIGGVEFSDLAENSLKWKTFFRST